MKSLDKRAKIYLTVLIISTLVFGQVFYLLTLLFVIYLLVYAKPVNNLNVRLRINSSSLTLRQRDRLSLVYEMSFDTLLPQLIDVNFELPFYIVPMKGNKKEHVFIRHDGDFSYQFECKANRRGTYEIGEVEVISHDPLGLFVKRYVVRDLKKVFVFPFLVPFEKLRIYLTDPLEGLKAKYQVNRDYSYVAGVRDYSEGDPVSMIHWKQTAHRGSLLVKEFDFSASKKIVVALNLYGKYKNASYYDYSSSLAASICYYSFIHHLPFGVVANFEGFEKTQVASGEFHLMNVFKLLSSDTKTPIATDDFIRRISLHIPFGSELFYIDGDLTEELMLSIINLKSLASKINIILMPDNSFVLPHEKPPNYFFKEATYMKLLGESTEALAKEGVFVYPILGKDYATIMEQ
ncbi:MAG: DUF58 domain-containing protein [Caldisericaceae bacterium]